MGATKLLNFLSSNKTEIGILFLSLFVLFIFFNWFAWILGLGRFKKKQDDDNGEKPIRYILVELFAKIINDFRHLLALIIILIFAVILGLGMLHTGFEIDKMADALQAVVSTLGGLVGSIIGYYFGESAALKRNTEEAPVRTIGVQQAVQSPDISSEDGSIFPAPEVDKNL